MKHIGDGREGGVLVDSPGQRAGGGLKLECMGYTQDAIEIPPASGPGAD